MTDGVTSAGSAPPPANQAGYDEASCSADSSAQSFLNVLCQEGQPVCTDPTAPTPREQAAQQSLPENERHLPGFWQMTNGGFLVQCGIPNDHLSENSKKSEESKSQAPAQDSRSAAPGKGASPAATGAKTADAPARDPILSEDGTFQWDDADWS